MFFMNEDEGAEEWPQIRLMLRMAAQSAVGPCNVNPGRRSRFALPWAGMVRPDGLQIGDSQIMEIIKPV
jgi:hypothetical protein